MKRCIQKVPHHGREIYGVIYLPETAEACPLVIFSHGFNGTHEAFAKYGEYLAARGIGAYAYDFCGGSVRSKSGLKTTEMSIFTEQEDLNAVIAAAKTWKEIDANQIFLFGESQGGLVTALTAEQHLEDIQGVLLLYPALCIADDWNKKFPDPKKIPEQQEFWGVTLGKIFFQSVWGFHPFEQIGKFNKEVFIFHGDKDDIVSPEYSRKAVSLYPHASMELFPGEGHGFSEMASQRVMRLTHEFVKRNLSEHHDNL